MNRVWQMRLDDAWSNDDVLAIVAEFLAAWDSPELRAIPADLLPANLHEAAQVNAYAFLLAHMLTGDARTQPGLHRMSTFFTKASLRIFQLAENARVPVAPGEELRSNEA